MPNNPGKPKKPSIAGEVKKKANQLMQSYFRKMSFAAEQEKIGKSQVERKVERDPRGYPVGKQRLAIAAKARTEAKRDSTRAVKLNPALIKKKK